MTTPRVTVPVDPTPEMIEAADAVDWSITDTRAALINIWTTAYKIAEGITKAWGLRSHPAPDALGVAVEALEKIKCGEITVFDDDLQCEVVATMDGEEASEIASAALRALQAEQGAK